MSAITRPAIKLEQNGKTLTLTTLPAKELVDLSYVARRGHTTEDGAIQRILNSRRISSISQFTIAVGEFPNSIILNWVNDDHALSFGTNEVVIPSENDSAQVIDGQHRIAGIEDAICKDASIATLEVPVVLYENLSTQECADIFLAINTEQKTVPRSLVFDLYGVASQQVADPDAVRARDIINYLDTDDASPYFSRFVWPGPKKQKGVALSTAVSAIKPLVGESGLLSQSSTSELNRQRAVFTNFFTALSEKYADKWDKSDNVFFTAAGFGGAIQFLNLKIIPHCIQMRSFKKETIVACIEMSYSDLIDREDIKGKSGSEGKQAVYQKLCDVFQPNTGTSEEIEF